MYAKLLRRFPRYRKSWISPSFVSKLQIIHYWHPMNLSMSNGNELRIIFEFLHGFILGSEFRVESIGTHSIHFLKMAVFLIDYETFNKQTLEIPHLIILDQNRLE